MNFKNALRRFLNVYFQEWEAFICSMPTTSTSPTWTQNTQLWMGNCQSSVIYMPWTSAIRRTLKKQLRQGLKVHVILVSAWDHFNASRNLCNLKMLMLVNWGGCCCPWVVLLDFDPEEDFTLSSPSWDFHWPSIHFTIL